MRMRASLMCAFFRAKEICGRHWRCCSEQRHLTLTLNDSRETKICLKGRNTQDLLDLEKRAQELNLPCYLVEDAGRTQIPAGSLTVLSILGRVEDVNKVTGHLKLL